jgi:hypothetical protein
MEKRIKLFNRAVQSLLGGALLFGLLFIVSCDNGDDPEPEPYQLPGIYTFNKAILTSGADALADTLNFPVSLIPTDITDQMASGLLVEAECSNPANGAVELKSDFKLFFTCLTESKESPAGTWNINGDSTELTLNLSVSAGTLPLKIEELKIDETNDVIGGSILNFPITKPLLAGFLTGLPNAEDILAGIPENTIIFVDVDIEFQKEE